MTASDIIKCIPAGVCSAGAHAASVFSLAAGGVAFLAKLSSRPSPYLRL